MKFFFIFALVTSSLRLEAQEICGTDYYHRFMMQTDTEYRSRFTNIQEQLRINKTKADLQRPVDQVYTIPVVVHVIHLGEPVGTGTNISYATIYGAIQGLNNRFRNVIGTSTDIEVQFCLATRSPNGCPTNGINRVNGSGVAGYVANGMSITVTCGANPPNHTVLKEMSRWPVSEYYNIWVVNKICGGFGGWTFYPNGNNYDGAAMCYNLMSINNPLLSHEVGHGFNLYHTFEGDGGNLVCPSNMFCVADGDGICDTPPHKQGDCGIANPCTSLGVWDNSRFNFMSYCSNGDRFTPGQKDRMRLTFTTFPRAQLLNSIGCSAPIAPPTGPITGSSFVCEGSTQTYSVTALAGASNYSWNLPPSGGWAGTSTTNSIQVTTGTTSGDISVAPTFGCGTGSTQTLSVAVNLVPAQPNPISGPIIVSPGDQSSYTINPVLNATGYSWQIANGPGGNITNGQNTNSINISWSTTGSYTLIVNPTNSCGAGTPRSLNVIVSPLTGMNDADNQFRLKVYPNPTNGECILTGTGFAGKKISIAVTNIWGQTIISSSELAMTNDYRKVFDLKGLSQGFYFATIIVNGKIYERKIARIN